MAKKRDVVHGSDETAEILKNMFIVQLGLAGISRHTIRKIVRCSMTRVTTILKHLKAADKAKTA